MNNNRWWISYKSSLLPSWHMCISQPHAFSDFLFYIFWRVNHVKESYSSISKFCSLLSYDHHFYYSCFGNSTDLIPATGDNKPSTILTVEWMYTSYNFWRLYFIALDDMRKRRCTLLCKKTGRWLDKGLWCLYRARNIIEHFMQHLNFPLVNELNSIFLLIVAIFAWFSLSYLPLDSFQSADFLCIF